MKAATLLGAILCALTLGARAGEADAPSHAMLPGPLARAVAEFDRAQIDGDAALLQRLLADDYALVNSRALVENKADFIRDYSAPGFKLKPYKVEDEIVRHWADGAVLAGLVTLEGSSNGKPFSVRLRFADVWRQRDGRWQVVFTEATRVPPP